MNQNETIEKIVGGIIEMADKLENEFLKQGKEVNYESCLIIAIKVMDGLNVANFYYPHLIQAIEKKSKSGINLI